MSGPFRLPQYVGETTAGAGLVFSGIGDILLELPVEGLFEAGMGAFILAMGVSACLGLYTNGIIIAGAVLFIISDALIAYPMFVAPIIHSSFWVMFTYYAAQALLTYGTLKMKPQG